MPKESLPSIVDAIAREHPDVWDAYGRLGEATEKAGPLDARTIRLVELALAIGAARQGAVHSHARRGLKLGLTPAELRQVCAPSHPLARLVGRRGRAELDRRRGRVLLPLTDGVFAGWRRRTRSAT